MEKYILWDWNGTLLDDTAAAVDTLNAMLERRGLPKMDAEFYRDNFAFPVKPFYQSLGMGLDGDDWDALAREYHEVYSAQAKRLNRGAIAALERAKGAAAGQSVISALRQDLLERDTAAYGVAGYMDRIFGVDNLDGASKVSRARELMEEVSPMARGAQFVLIGDSLHDKEVADEIGAECVLCGQGSHALWRLAEAGTAAATLAEALEAALRA